ncbi:MAG: hypothetical protein EOO41_01635, partial [Methanobacteriota archaeon]
MQERSELELAQLACERLAQSATQERLAARTDSAISFTQPLRVRMQAATCGAGALVTWCAQAPPLHVSELLRRLVLRRQQELYTELVDEIKELAARGEPLPPNLDTFLQFVTAPAAIRQSMPVNVVAAAFGDKYRLLLLPPPKLMWRITSARAAMSDLVQSRGCIGGELTSPASPCLTPAAGAPSPAWLPERALTLHLKPMHAAIDDMMRALSVVSVLAAQTDVLEEFDKASRKLSPADRLAPEYWFVPAHRPAHVVATSATLAYYSACEDGEDLGNNAFWYAGPAQDAFPGLFGILNHVAGARCTEPSVHTQQALAANSEYAELQQPVVQIMGTRRALEGARQVHALLGAARRAGRAAMKQTARARLAASRHMESHGAQTVQGEAAVQRGAALAHYESDGAAAPNEHAPDVGSSRTVDEQGGDMDSALRATQPSAATALSMDDTSGASQIPTLANVRNVSESGRKEDGRARGERIEDAHVIRTATDATEPSRQWILRGQRPADDGTTASVPAPETDENGVDHNGSYEAHWEGEVGGSGLAEVSRSRHDDSAASFSITTDDSRLETRAYEQEGDATTTPSRLKPGRAVMTTSISTPSSAEVQQLLKAGELVPIPMRSTPPRVAVLASSAASSMVSFTGRTLRTALEIREATERLAAEQEAAQARQRYELAARHHAALADTHEWWHSLGLKDEESFQELYTLGRTWEQRFVTADRGFAGGPLYAGSHVAYEAALAAQEVSVRYQLMRHVRGRQDAESRALAVLQEITDLVSGSTAYILPTVVAHTIQASVE